MPTVAQIQKQANSLARRQYQNKQRNKQSNLGGAGDMLRQQFEHLAVRFRNMSPEQRRVVAATAIGGGIGGLAGMAGAIDGSDARRSVIGDSLRGALAGGVVGGGGALGLNALTSPNNPLTGAPTTSDGPNWAGAVNALDEAQAAGTRGWLRRPLGWLDSLVGPVTGATIGAGGVAAHQYRPSAVAARRMDNLRAYLAKDGPGSALPAATRKNLDKLYTMLQNNPQDVGRVWREASQEAANQTRWLRRGWAKQVPDAWRELRRGRYPAQDIAAAYFKNKTPRRYGPGKPSRFFHWANRELSPTSAPIGKSRLFSPQGAFTGSMVREAMSPRPGLMNYYQRPGVRTLAGGAGGLAASFAPGLLLSALPTKELSNSQARRVIRDQL